MNYPYLKYRLIKYYRTVKRIVFSKLYFDSHHDIDKSILIAGSARSGTTWLADIISTHTPSRIMFEPFHSKMVKDYADFNYFQYMRPSDENPELFAFATKIFRGEIRDPWIDRQVEHLRPKIRVIKDVRINLLLNWLKKTFPQVPMILVIRHPCAVVLSRMKLGWWTDQDIAPFFSQPKLIEDYLADKMNLIWSAKTDVEKHAIIWCVHNLVPLHSANADQITVVFYENLYLQPEIELPRLFQNIQIDYKSSVLRSVNRPSMTSTRSSAIFSNEDQISHWKKELTSSQIAEITRVVEAFGLDDLYGDSY